MSQIKKRRLEKKHHKHWLHSGIIDASQMTYWRSKLFEAKENISFPIDSEHCNELAHETIEALRKYNLRYLVAKVPGSEAESWLSQGGAVVFKFWSLKYPEVKLYSGNNPNVI